MNKEQIINRHARNLKSLVGTGLAQDECQDIIKYAINEALTLYGVVSSAKNKEAIISVMKTMTDDERLDIITEFCKYCGDLDSSCQCWNDE